MNITTKTHISPSSALRRLQTHALKSKEQTEVSPRADSVHLSSEAHSLMEGGTGRRVSRNARAVYQRHGDQQHSLSDRNEVGQLISRSPQVDNSSDTHNDDIRCGGAALTNAMLLDGDYAANARAIRRLAEPAPGQEGRLAQTTAEGHRPFDMTREQREALSAMENGHLTPNQTSQIQEMMFQMADGIYDGSEQRQEGNDGISGVQMRRMVSRLSNAGAFPNTRSLNMRMDENGAGGYHWTTTSTNSSGTQHADSWPDNEHQGHDGYAEVRGVAPADRGDYVYQDGQAPGSFGTDVTLERRSFLSRRVTARERVENETGPDTVRAWGR